MKMQNPETHFTSVPAFLSKLWALVDDPSTNDLIYWDVTGRSFHVSDQMRFSKEILPMYFKHNNISSFIRQLNMYGFRKVMSSDSLSLKGDKEDLEFAHQYFVRGQECLIEAIKRKTSTQAQALPQLSRSEVSKIIGEVSTLKQHIDTITDNLESLKLENDILWKEMIDLRQKHARQQELVSKLLQFFASIINTERTPIKRKLPLMIRNSDISIQHNNRPTESTQSPQDLPEIALSADLSTSLSNSATDPYKNTLDNPGNVVVKQEPKLVFTDFNRDDLSKNLDSFQDSLDSLYELLSNNGNNICNLDPPVLEINGLGDFIEENNEDSEELKAKKIKLSTTKKPKTDLSKGKELTQYIPPEEWLNIPHTSATNHADNTEIFDSEEHDQSSHDKDLFSDKDAFSEYVFDDVL